MLIPRGWLLSSYLNQLLLQLSHLFHNPSEPQRFGHIQDLSACLSCLLAVSCLMLKIRDVTQRVGYFSLIA